jgi:hypothetical protein
MPRADEVIPKNKTEETILKFYTLLMKKDFDAWGELFVDDAVQENPFVPALDGLDAQFKGKSLPSTRFTSLRTGSSSSLRPPAAARCLRPAASTISAT